MNKKILITLVLFITFSSFILTKKGETPNKPTKPTPKKPSLVKELGPKNINDNLYKYDYVLIKFFTPWCPHCKQMKNDYIKLAEKISQEKIDNVLIAEVDCEKNRDLCMKYKVPGFPMLKLFKKDGKIKDYEDERSTDQMFDWLLKRTGPPAFTLIEEKEITEFIEKNKKIDVTAVIGFFDKLPTKTEKNKFFEEYLKTAENIDDFMFAQVIGLKKEIAAKFGIEKMNTIKVFRHFDKDVTFDGEPEKIDSFIKSYGYPIIDEINSKTFQRYIEAKLPVIVLFVNFTDSETKNKQMSFLTEIAKSEQLKGKLMWAVTDTVLYGEQLKLMGGNPDKTPAIAAMNIQQRQNFPYKGKWEKEEIIKWSIELSNGKIKPYLRTEEPPKKNDGDVKIVVGKTFNDLVLGDENDVLVLFYAPWCEHSKRIAPKYEQLGKDFKNVKNLVIAKIDADSNDTPVLVEGFPTIYYFPKNSKDKPVLYDGNRKIKNIKKFISKNASEDVKKEVEKILTIEKKIQKEEKKNKKKAKKDEL